nr:alkaline phosphatase D family protein [Motilibacter aurantiacus]
MVPGSARAVPRPRPGRVAYPFLLGVASGDPYPDGVVLWTRLAVDPLALDGLGGLTAAKYDVEFQVAEDERFTRVVRFGTKHARRDAGYAIHVELTGLPSAHEYFYRFRIDEHISPVGRTRTAPAAGSTVTALTMAFASCSNYSDGYFTAYRHLADEDADIVLHLGDYIYEGAGAGFRPHSGGREIFTLADYRARYAQYKSDPDLQAAHAAAPWVAVPDDHEVENNYADEIPDVDPPGPAFVQRRAAAYQAYYENMPFRRSSTPDGSDMQLFRRLGWGDLATFHMLDTRQFRSDQACGDGNRAGCTAAFDPDRSITGEKQERWLLDGLHRTTTTWDLLGQQVFFSLRDQTAGAVESFSMDSWDGYVASRERIMRGFGAAGAANPVVLTGDVHANYASDIKADWEDPSSRTLGVELVTTSITSGGNGSDLSAGNRTALAENPHIRFANAQRGYVRTRIEHGQLRADYRVVQAVRTQGSPITTRASFVVEAGNPGLQPVPAR